MEILSSRTLLRPSNLERTQAFYRDTLGLAVFRVFGPPDSPGMVFFCGNGLLEVSGQTQESVTTPQFALWMQVRDVMVEYERLETHGVAMLREPKTEPWGLIEAWIADPDGVRIVLVQIPAEHPLRQDQR